MTTGDRAKMFSSHLSSTPKMENSGISGHFCSGAKCPVCHPDDLFKRMSDNIDAQNRLALESGTLPPEEEAILREVTYPHEAMQLAFEKYGHDGETFENFQKRYLIIEKDGVELMHVHSECLGAWPHTPNFNTIRSLNIPDYNDIVIDGIEPSPDQIETSTPLKQKLPPSNLLKKLMGRADPISHHDYKKFI